MKSEKKTVLHSLKMQAMNSTEINSAKNPVSLEEDSNGIPALAGTMITDLWDPDQSCSYAVLISQSMETMK